MKKIIDKIIQQYIWLLFFGFLFSCNPPSMLGRIENTQVPEGFGHTTDTLNDARSSWKTVFDAPHLVALIDTALVNNQELNMIKQEIQISQNEIKARKGEYLPFVGFVGAAGVDKVGKYSRNGAVESNLKVDGEELPEPFPDYALGLQTSWELDIWKKLRNAKKAAIERYLASVEGKNFMVTELIAEIANSYYELLALDSRLRIVTRSIEIQTNALKIVKQQKQAAKTTELAVKRFEAQVLRTKSLQFEIQQKITIAENKINYLIGRFPQPIARDRTPLGEISHKTVAEGIPTQLLQNRPDIRQAEFELAAAKLDVKSARAAFYPSLGIKAGIGFQAFNPSYLVTAPESLVYNLAGELTAPLINRNAIKARYYSAGAKQLQAVYHYEQSILNGYVEVANQLTKIRNLGQEYDLTSQRVEALTESVTISNNLFRSARADYMEVLLTQRDALESEIELIETKKQQIQAMVGLYRALGGGWR